MLPPVRPRAPADILAAEREVFSVELERLSRSLVDVNAALERLDAGDYGSCVECGAAIASARLEYVPWTPRCLACQDQAERAPPRQETSMEMYQHDNAGTFRFRLSGALDDAAACELEQAWRTASSVLRGKELVIEVSGLTSVTDTGLQLLERMRESGARLDATAPLQLAEPALRVGVRPREVSPGRRLRDRAAAFLPRSVRSKL